MPTPEIQLPPICPPNAHKWVKLTLHGCGAGSGDHAIGELLVAGAVIPNGGEGTACTICFQVFGAPEGTRSNDLTFAFERLSSW